jgi:anti-sigma regulatory factor (Ser/Thr protein kinase)
LTVTFNIDRDRGLHSISNRVAFERAVKTYLDSRRKKRNTKKEYDIWGRISIVLTEVFINVREHAYRYQGGPIVMSVEFAPRGPMVYVIVRWKETLTKEVLDKMNTASETGNQPGVRGNGLHAIREAVSEFNLPVQCSPGWSEWRLGVA